MYQWLFHMFYMLLLSWPGNSCKRESVFNGRGRFWGMGDTYISQGFQTGNIDGSVGWGGLLINPHGLEDIFKRSLQVSFHFWQFIHYKLTHKWEQH